MAHPVDNRAARAPTEFYKVKVRAKTEGKLAAVTAGQPGAKSVRQRTSDELDELALQVRVLGQNLSQFTPVHSCSAWSGRMQNG